MTLKRYPDDQDIVCDVGRKMFVESDVGRIALACLQQRIPQGPISHINFHSPKSVIEIPILRVGFYFSVTNTSAHASPKNPRWPARVLTAHCAIGVQVFVAAISRNKAK